MLVEADSEEKAIEMLQEFGDEITADYQKEKRNKNRRLSWDFVLSDKYVRVVR